MTWTGTPDQLKSVLRGVGADFRWGEKFGGSVTFFELGHVTDDLTSDHALKDGEAGAGAMVPVAPLIGGRFLQVIDGARYYVRGEPLDLMDLLRDVPQGDPNDAGITDVLVPGVAPAEVKFTGTQVIVP